MSVPGSPVPRFITPKEQELSSSTANLTRGIVLAGAGSYLADYLRTRRAEIFIKVNRGIHDRQPAYRAVLRSSFTADARLHPKMPIPHPVGCGCFLAFGSGAGKEHGRALGVMGYSHRVVLLPSSVLGEGAEGQSSGGSAARTVEQLGLDTGHGGCEGSGR